MTLKEFAENTQMDFEGTLERFANMESLLVKFLKKFVSDPTYEELRTAIENQDFSTVERAAHTLKGVAGNLGFQKLFYINQEIVDAVRNDNVDKINTLFEEDKQEYEMIIENLKMLD
ncbi:MAG: Hpt domain-containing protein [Eubacteriales bacterium]|nr:Hpt domain-containing protein [Eubacteriales bacterium]